MSSSMLEATEGLSEGPVTSRPASLGLLLVSLKNVNNQLTRSNHALSDHKERLNSLQSLPVTELVRLADVNPTDKLPTVLVRHGSIFNPHFDHSLFANFLSVIFKLQLMRYFFCQLAKILLV